MRTLPSNRCKQDKQEPVIEEPIVEEPIVEELETTITETIAEIVNDKIEEAVPVEEAPLASFEVAEAETADTLVSSPLTGGGRHTGAWAGLSLVSLLGILFLNKKRVTE